MQLNAKLIRYFLRAKYRSSGGVSVLVVPIVYLMCPLKAAQMGTTSTQQVEETQAAFAQGKIFTECLCDFTRTRRCFSSALATMLYVVHGKPHHSMGDVFDSDLKVDLLQIASQLTQRGDPYWAASSRIAPQFTIVTLRLNKMAGGIEANPKSQPTYAFWQADHHKMLTRCRHTKHSKTPRSR